MCYWIKYDVKTHRTLVTSIEVIGEFISVKIYIYILKVKPVLLNKIVQVEQKNRNIQKRTAATGGTQILITVISGLLKAQIHALFP